MFIKKIITIFNNLFKILYFFYFIKINKKINLYSLKSNFKKSLFDLNNYSKHKKLLNIILTIKTL